MSSYQPSVAYNASVTDAKPYLNQQPPNPRPSSLDSHLDSIVKARQRGEDISSGVCALYQLGLDQVQVQAALLETLIRATQVNGGPCTRVGEQRFLAALRDYLEELKKSYPST